MKPTQREEPLGHLAAFTFLTPFISEPQLHAGLPVLSVRHTIIHSNIFCSRSLDMGVITVSKASWEGSKAWSAASGGIILIDNRDPV